MRRPILWAALAWLGAAASGCGPVEYLTQVTRRAYAALENARAAEAEKFAPYEYTAAREYVAKARELAGYSRYEEAVDYGRLAETFANKATQLSRERRTGDDGQAAPASGAPAGGPAAPGGAP